MSDPPPRLGEVDLTRIEEAASAGAPIDPDKVLSLLRALRADRARADEAAGLIARLREQLTKERETVKMLKVMLMGKPKG